MVRGLSRDAFEHLVAEALEELPQRLAEHMSNVDIVIEDEPGDDVYDEFGDDAAGLLGLYQGIPLTERGNNYYGVLPDRITLFKRHIERAARSRDELREMVRTTVIHEIAHHFGIDDRRLEELGWD